VRIWIEELIKSYSNKALLSSYDYAASVLGNIGRILTDNKKTAILFLDEFDGLISNFPNLAAILRNVLQKTPICFFGTATAVTETLFSSKSPLYMFFKTIALSGFDASSTAEMIHQYSKDSNVHFTEDAIKRVFELTGGNPYYINLLMSYAEKRAVSMGLNKVGVEILEGAIHGLSPQLEILMKYVFSTLSPQQRKILEVMSKFDYSRPSQVAKEMGLPTYRITPQIKRLTEKGLLIMRERGIYEFSDRVIKEYLCDKLLPVYV
jgi:hypothetical protein